MSGNGAMDEMERAGSRLVRRALRAMRRRLGKGSQTQGRGKKEVRMRGRTGGQISEVL
jgi:hypothetical protein